MSDNLTINQAETTRPNRLDRACIAIGIVILIAICMVLAGSHVCLAKEAQGCLFLGFIGMIIVTIIAIVSIVVICTWRNAQDTVEELT